jgi:biopolymer transport protein TolR
MAMSASAGGGKQTSRRRRGGKRRAAMAEINMTPFIDVVLVLLIIFMVAAPLMTVGVPLDLPKTGAGQLNLDRVPLTLSINAAGEVFVGEAKVAPEGVVEAITAKAKDGFEERIYLHADKGVPYGTVASIMARVTEGGFKKVALVTEQEQN